MLAIRAAILGVLFGLQGSSSIFFNAPAASPAKDGVFAASQPDSPVICPVVFKLPCSSTLARFTPWKARPKIVLVEANHQFSEETDLGPALLPRGLCSPVSIAPSTPRLPTLSPLRC
jgi:hypothetical protein